MPDTNNEQPNKSDKEGLRCDPSAVQGEINHAAGQSKFTINTTAKDCDEERTGKTRFHEKPL